MRAILAPAGYSASDARRRAYKKSIDALQRRASRKISIPSTIRQASNPPKQTCSASPHAPSPFSVPSPIPHLRRASLRSYATHTDSPNPLTITLTPAEQSSRQLGPHSLERVVHALRANGLVAIANAILHPLLPSLNTRTTQDAHLLQPRGSSVPYNYTRSNLHQSAPPICSHFHPHVFPNPFTAHTTSHVLSPRPRLKFRSDNAAMPPFNGVTPSPQPVHSDADFVQPSRPLGSVVCVPLVDTGPEDGSTEVWLGTHVLGRLAA